jgi:hypothetical protein
LIVEVARDDQPAAWAELRDAVTPRTLALVSGVLVLQLGFIFSYVAAFHNPRPHRVPIAVVAPAQSAQRVIAAINAIGGNVARAHAVPDEATARRQIRSGTDSAAFILNPSAGGDQLLLASGGGEAVAEAVKQIGARVEAREGRKFTATDIVPLQAGDARGLTGFYLVIGWIVGGYLFAAMLGIATGPRPASTRRAALRVAAIPVYAALSGLGGALIVDQLLGALTGHFLALWWLGALIVAASAAATIAFEVLFGIVGIGIVILAFVVLGNPSAGGAYQLALLPGFWRAIGGWLPNGAGTDTVRRIVYFGSHGIAGHLITLALYVVIGTLVTLGVTRLRGRESRSGRQ